MATPIVHASIGLVIASTAIIISKTPSKFLFTSSRNLIAFVLSSMFLACLPDIDIPVSYILTGDVRTYHFGITHTLFFCVAVALFLRIKLTTREACWACLLVLSHVLTDCFTGRAFGFSETAGIRLFMPFSQYVFVSEITLFPGVEHKNWWSKNNMLRVLYDIVIFVPLAALFVYLAVKKARFSQR